MKNATAEIKQLCDAWWDKLAHASLAEQQRYAEALLRMLDWEMPIPFSPKAEAKKIGAIPYLLRAAGQTNLSMYFVMPGVLDPPSSVVDRGLDFCPATRRLVQESRTLSLQYTLITDLYRAYLYDVRTEELLVYADDPKQFNDRVVPILSRARLELGALEELRRQPRSAAARQFREWGQRWSAEITRDSGLADNVAALAIDRLTTARYLFEHNILRRTRSRLEQRFNELADRAESGMTLRLGDALVQLFHDMWFDWHIDLFEGQPQLDAALRNDMIAAGLLKESRLQARSKFSIATILESFNHGDPAEKMRVRAVPDSNDERDHFLSRQTVSTVDSARIEIDLLEEGYRSIFHWFDKVVALYERLELDFNHKTEAQAPQETDLDLFAWSEIDASRPNACSDKLAFACEHGFGIYYTSQQQFRVARLLLTMHLISRYEQHRQALEHFPSLDKVLLVRPKVLPADRVMRSSYAANDYLDNA